MLPHHLRRVIDLLLDGGTAIHNDLDLKTPVRARSMMALLQDKGALSITEIAGRLRLTHPHIIRKAAELEALGLVSEAFDESDQRKRLIELTTLGRREAKAIMKTFESIRRMNEDLSAEIGVDLYKGALRAKAALEDKSCVERIKGAEKKRKKRVA